MATTTKEMLRDKIRQGLAVITLAAGAAVLAVPVAAQESGGAALGSQERPLWLKICNQDPRNNKKICLVTQELRASTGQTLTSVAVRDIESVGLSLLVSVPLGTLIESGVAVQIDNGQTINLPVRICLPRACYAELAVKSTLVNAMKAGGVLKVAARNQQGKPYAFDLSLRGFTAAYIGAPVDPQQLQSNQQQLQSELQKRVQESKKKLIDQQNKEVNSGN